MDGYKGCDVNEDQEEYNTSYYTCSFVLRVWLIGSMLIILIMLLKCSTILW